MANGTKALVNKGTGLRAHTQLLAVLAEYRAPDLQGNALRSFHGITSWGLSYKWVISGQVRGRMERKSGYRKSFSKPQMV